MSPRRPAAPDDGFTLVELLVTVMLSMLVLALVTGLVQISKDVLVTERARTDELGTGFPAVEEIQRSLRSADSPPTTGPAVATATATQLTLHSLGRTAAAPGDPASATTAQREAAQPKQVTFTADPATGRLTVTTVQPRLTGGTWSYTGATTTRRLASGLVNDAARPLFTYRDDSGAVITGGLTDPAVRAQIAFVEIDLVLDTDDGRGDPVVIHDTVRLANYRTQETT